MIVNSKLPVAVLLTSSSKLIDIPPIVTDNVSFAPKPFPISVIGSPGLNWLLADGWSIDPKIASPACIVGIESGSLFALSVTTILKVPPGRSSGTTKAALKVPEASVLTVIGVVRKIAPPAILADMMSFAL